MGITPFDATWAVAGTTWMGRHVLRQVGDGVLQSQRIWPTRGATGVVRRPGLHRRWRRARPGDWLVVLLPQARDRYRYGAYGSDGEEVLRTRPPADVREALDAAAARPVGDQLRACGFEPAATGPIVPATASGPNGTLEVYADPARPDRIAVHLVSAGHLVVVGLEPLVRWDPAPLPPDAAGRRAGAAPAGLGPDPKPFRGRIADLVVAHLPGMPAAGRPPGGPCGGDRRWTVPAAHFHTAAGEVVCGASDGRAADLANDLTDPADEPADASGPAEA